MSHTKASVPRLLLISETPLSNCGPGIDRTLFNLLDRYPMERFMLYTRGNSSSSLTTSPPFDQRVAHYHGEYLPTLKNRLGSVLNPVIENVNFQLADLLPSNEWKKIVTFDPELVLICPNSPLPLLVGHKVIRQLDCPFLIYFMDDWLFKSHVRWFSGGVQSYSSFLLSEADGWLMISTALRDELASRYGLTPKKELVVHNPVDTTALGAPDFSVHTGTYRVVYAGSIWPMHYDAIALVSNAIFDLRQDGYDIELILHTPSTFWFRYEEHWKSQQVTYGGMIPYQDLQNYLRRADLLLVASSFKPEYAHMSRSSVQTKLTDYMASGRPIFSCGPTYGACNNFLKYWKCGLICEQESVLNVKQKLLQAFDNRAKNQDSAHKAYLTVQDKFDKNRVINKLYSFISESAIIPGNSFN